jgi:hypothetical protein
MARELKVHWTYPKEIPMKLSALILFSVVLGLSFTQVRDAHAITSCAVACGASKPCSTPCYLGTYQNPFVTRCDQVGPCRKVLATEPSLQLTANVSASVVGDDACPAVLAAQPGLTGLVAWLFGWAQGAADWMEQAADRFAFRSVEGVARRG